MTIGIVEVAFWAAAIAGVAFATMTLGLSATISSARAGRKTVLPVRLPNIDDEVPALLISQLAKGASQGTDANRGSSRVEVPHAPRVQFFSLSVPG
jgi:hypothetical protein